MVCQGKMLILLAKTLQQEHIPSSLNTTVSSSDSHVTTVSSHLKPLASYADTAVPLLAPAKTLRLLHFLISQAKSPEECVCFFPCPYPQTHSYLWSVCAVISTSAVR